MGRCPSQSKVLAVHQWASRQVSMKVPDAKVSWWVGLDRAALQAMIQVEQPRMSASRVLYIGPGALLEGRPMLRLGA